MLFAVLVSSVLLSIGLSIFNLTLKELTLSSSGRESQFSFYAADTGVECALYWDFKSPSQVAYATSSNSQSGFWRDTFIDSDAPSCLGASLSYNFKNASSTTATTGVTRFNLTIPSGACATVSVTKDYANPSIPVTSIDSRGYNTCDQTDPNRVERALKVTY